MRILVIEDNRIQARIVERCLQEGGPYDLTFVRSSEEALNCLEEEEGYDLLIIDWMLPGTSGLDFARILRNSKSFRDIPIIMQTAKDRPEHVQQALAAGVDDYVVKPLLDCRSLIQKIRKVTAARSDEGPRRSRWWKS